MYLDYYLFAFGVFFFLLFLLIGILLIRSKKQGQDYRRILREETERIDVVSTVSAKKASTRQGFEGNHVTASTKMPGETALQLGEDNSKSLNTGLDVSILAGKYELLWEIHEGNMSRVFVARHVKLGNEWVVKFVPGNHVDLIEEADILKKLNHISLPQIIDILKNDHGTFLVERYIEGCSLSDALRLGQRLTEGQICDWGIQLAQVLHYLHNLQPPIFHCDLKPANIMVTYDNNLVLVDFGIAKRQGDGESANYLTYAYAAPEQFLGSSKGEEIAQKRFGLLPVGHENWKIDARTDLYSVGVILYELVTGRQLKPDNIQEVYRHTTQKLADIICRCLNVNPEERFQTAKELSDALEEVRSERGGASHRLFMRRVATVFCAVMLTFSLVSAASAVYIHQSETRSVIISDPGYAVVTSQQSIRPLIQKISASGKSTVLPLARIRWEHFDESIVRIDGDQLYGINMGTVRLSGKYRDKEIYIDVEVREPTEDNTSISLRYPSGVEVSVFAGSGERDFIDGTFAECAFVSPESLSANADTVYLTDSGMIRLLRDGITSSLAIEPDYVTAALVRQRNGIPYILTGPWYADNDSSYYGFGRVVSGHAEILFETEAAWSTISDFAFSDDGTLWYIQQNMGSGATTLNTLDTENGEAQWVMNLPDGATYLTIDSADTLYVSVPDSGLILRVGKGDKTWAYFAGLDEQRDMIDGTVPQFYRPTSLAMDGQSLYVLDFGTVRKITVDGSGVAATETLAGIPTGETSWEIASGVGHAVTLPISALASLTIGGDGEILLSDPNNSVIYSIQQSGEN